jgi:Domain of unknown function (DUF5018)
MKNLNIGFLLSLFLLLVVSCGKTDEPTPIKSNEKQIISFKVTVNAQEIVGIIAEADKKIGLSLPYKSDVKALAPVITISDKATISPESGVTQDFTNPIKYTVKAQDGTTAEYLVTVTVMPPSKCLPLKVGYLTEIFSREITFIYNSNDQVTKITATTSRGFSGEGIYTYDSRGYPIKLEGSIFDPNGGYISYTYNDKNQLIRTERFTTSGLDIKNEYGYNGFGQKISDESYYSSQGVLKKCYYKVFEYKSTSSKDYSLQNEFNENGELYSTTEFEYDDKKIPISFVFSDGPNHNITKRTKKDASGKVLYIETITYEFNEIGYQTKSVSNLDESEKPNVTTRTYTYDCK